MKLEFIDISPYAPWKLKFKQGNESVKQLTCLLLPNFCACESDFSHRKIEDIKPLLRPLSDFTGKKTGREVMDMLNCTLAQVHELWKLEDGAITLEQVTVGLYNVMNKNHIDYNNLIGKGLAICKT